MNSLTNKNNLDMSNVVYLKNTDDLNDVFVAYDVKTSKSITLVNDDCSIETYSELEDFNFALQYDFKIGYVICDKSEFDEALNNFKNNLNLIIDKL